MRAPAACWGSRPRPARGADLGGIGSFSSSEFEVPALCGRGECVCGPGGDGAPQTGQVAPRPERTARGALPSEATVRGQRADSGVDL